MKHLIIECPNNNIEERKYIIETIIGDFLNLEFYLNVSTDNENYIFRYENKEIIFEDHFFRKFPENLSYLLQENLPQKVNFLTNDYINDLPIIYGRNQLKLEENSITCGLDIFASSFFMLSRWEEHVIEKKNSLGRCDENELFVVKNNLYGRPIVNEYCEFVKRLLIKIGVPFPVNKRKSSVFLTHDVDWCHLSSFKELVGNLERMVLKQKLVKKAFMVFYRYCYYKIFRINPFDSFDQLMDGSERFGFINSFYFKACKANERGFTYDVSDPKVQRIIENIIKRGHLIGYHPSENTVDNFAQFKLELDRLKKSAFGRVVGGRNHGLFYNRNTFKFWEAEHLKYDSGLGFQFQNGFRCGICFEFFIFDIFERRTLELEERPFIVMDTVFMRNKSSPKEMYEEVIKLVEVVKKYDGVICLNWHSNLINAIERRRYKKTYFNILNYLKVEENEKK